MIGEEGIRKRPNKRGDSSGINERPSFNKTIKSMDFFNKRSFKATEKTNFGAIISFVIMGLVGLLFLSEFLNYMKVRRQDILSVDESLFNEMQIFFNITFPTVQCGDLHVDTVDASGEAAIDIASSITKQPYDKEGKIMAMGQGDEINKFDSSEYDPEDDPHSPFYCGRCYTGEARRDRRARRKKLREDRKKKRAQKKSSLEVDPENQQPEDETKVCCNSCEQVIQQLKKLKRPVPPKQEIKQCIHEISRLNPGCNMYGVLEVDRVTGNFHFAPGMSYTEYRGFGGRHIHEFVPEVSQSWNASHILHEIRFGKYSKEIDYPLNGKKKIFGGVTVHKYFINVVPTVIEGMENIIGKIFKRSDDGGYNQISFTEHVHIYEEGEVVKMPGVFFVYDFSPIMVTYRYYRFPFTHFLVKICAVIGGIFAVSKFLDKFLESTLDSLMSKKFD